jgi:hypothetical protein
MDESVIDTDTAFADLMTKARYEAGALVVQRTQDTTPYLDENQRQYNAASSWRPYASTARKDQSLRKVASIPNIIAEQWMKEGVNVFSNDPEQRRKVRQKLNSNEYKYLRTFPGRV